MAKKLRNFPEDQLIDCPQNEINYVLFGSGRYRVLQCYKRNTHTLKELCGHFISRELLSIAKDNGETSV